MKLTMTVPEAAKILGVSRTTAYKMIQDEKCPVEVLHLGGRIVVPTVPLYRLLGMDPPAGA